MPASMNHELQMWCENVPTAYEIAQSLEELYQDNSRVTQYNLCVSMINQKLREGVPPGDHVIKIINNLTQLEVNGMVFTHQFKVNMILQSLPSSFKPFITNFNLNMTERQLPELLNELQDYYQQMNKGKGHENVYATTSSRSRSKKAN